MAGDALNLVLTGAGDISPTPIGVESPAAGGQDNLPRLPRAIPFEARWFVNGVEGGSDNVGRISISGDRINVTYHAPSRAPANNPVSISAELSEFTSWDIVNRRRRRFTTVIVFKHVRIIDEYKFKLKLEIDDVKLVCNPQQRYYDEAEVDIRVANGMVTISNLVNKAATIIPQTIQLGGPDCTFTCDVGVGSLNIISSSGDLFETESGKYVWIRMVNSGATNPGATINCKGESTSVPAKTLPELMNAMAFALQDDAVQTQNLGLAFKWTLTPE